jgi:hypothetical protein
MFGVVACSLAPLADGSESAAYLTRARTRTPVAQEDREFYPLLRKAAEVSAKQARHPRPTHTHTRAVAGLATIESPDLHLIYT